MQHEEAAIAAKIPPAAASFCARPADASTTVGAANRLITPEGGRRVYSQSHRRTLGFIRRARDLGFSLDEIRALLDLDGSGRASCAEVREIASHHLVNVRAKLADLARLETVLSDTVGQCAANITPACPLLGLLDPEDVSLKKEGLRGISKGFSQNHFERR